MFLSPECNKFSNKSINQHKKFYSFFHKLLWHFVMIPVSILSRIVIFTMGWHAISQDVINNLSQHDRSVLVFSHTTYADFFILLFYLATCYNHEHCIRMLVAPKPFRYMGWFLHNIGAIPSSCIQYKNQNSTSRIIGELQKLKKCIFLISPKGTIVKSAWRTGYFHIAKELNAVIHVAGLDYEKKKVIVTNIIPYTNQTQEFKLQTQLKHELSKIIPLFPEDEAMDIREHDENKRGIVDIWWFGLILTITGFGCAFCKKLINK